MPSYSSQFKEQAVRRLMPQNSQTISMVSQDLGIAAPTLYAWKRQFEIKSFVAPAKFSSPDKWDMKSKLAAIIQTTSMNEPERSVYCREHGLYPEQLDAWKAAFESADVSEGSVITAAVATDVQSSSYLRNTTKSVSRPNAQLHLRHFH